MKNTYKSGNEHNYIPEIQFGILRKITTIKNLGLLFHFHLFHLS